MSTTPGTRLDLKTVRVRARYDDDSAARGTVTFVRTGGPLRDNVENEFVLPKPVPMQLDNEGEGSAVLGVTDDPDLNPSGFTWTATFEVTGTPWPPFTFELPRSLPATVWLNALAEVSTLEPVVSYVLATSPRLLPAGGTTGQVLAKTNNNDWAVAWQAGGGGGGAPLPPGGNVGMALVKTANADGAADWGNPALAGNGVVVGGTAGQVLAKVSNANYATTWVSAPSTAGGITYGGGPDLATSSVEVALDVLAGRVTPVDNGANATPTRPAGVTSVLWFGSVRPTASMVPGDIYTGDIGAGGGTSFGAPTGSVDIGLGPVTGVAATAVRSDHVHPHPAPGTGYPQPVIRTRSDGTATTPARSDHVHAYGAATITDVEVAVGAAIARAKLALAPPDSAANVASERTLGKLALQAAPGTLHLSAPGSIPTMSTVGVIPIDPSFPGWMLMSQGPGFAPTYVVGIRVVKHGAVASTPRPIGDVVMWVGSVFPSNFNSAAGDMWNDQS